jgi:RNA polymerase sigma-70 factor (ECF subfamily)
MRYVRARVASRELAEDLVGDVFCRALAALSSYRQLRATPLPWLYTIAAHRVADYYRSQRATFPIETIEALADGSDGPDEVVTARESMREVWEASKGLPESQRRALWFRYGEDLELKEIAARMKRSVDAVKLLIHPGHPACVRNPCPGISWLSHGPEHIACGPVRGVFSRTEAGCGAVQLASRVGGGLTSDRTWD